MKHFFLLLLLLSLGQTVFGNDSRFILLEVEGRAEPFRVNMSSSLNRQGFYTVEGFEFYNLWNRRIGTLKAVAGLTFDPIKNEMSLNGNTLAKNKIHTLSVMEVLDPQSYSIDTLVEILPPQERVPLYRSCIIKLLNLVKF